MLDLLAMDTLKTIGFGGGCHWCTEAVLQQLKGVLKVKQGYISSDGKNTAFSEAVMVTFNAEIVSVEELIEVHLATHASSSNHSFREKYRSAIYYLNDPMMDESSENEAVAILSKIRERSEKNYVTQVLEMVEFKPSRVSIQNYYKKHPEASFCQRYIIPKISLLKIDYSSLISKTLKNG